MILKTFFLLIYFSCMCGLNPAFSIKNIDTSISKKSNWFTFDKNIEQNKITDSVAFYINVYKSFYFKYTNIDSSLSYWKKQPNI